MVLQQWIPLLKNCVSAEKEHWMLYNRASDYWRIVPAAVEESCKRILKYKMDVWYNVIIAAVLDFQITYYMQHQFHIVFPSILTKAGRGGSRDTTAQKMKFPIKDFFSKFDQIRRKLQIWSHLLKKSLMENFIFLCSALLTKPLLLKLFNMLKMSLQEIQFWL